MIEQIAATQKSRASSDSDRLKKAGVEQCVSFSWAEATGEVLAKAEAAVSL